MGLCYYCQRRIDFIEKKKEFRYECSCIEKSVGSCYGYVPVIPIITKKSKGDPRPRFSLVMISAREEYVGKAQAKLCKIEKNGNACLFWQPDEKLKIRKDI